MILIEENKGGDMFSGHAATAFFPDYSIISLRNDLRITMPDPGNSYSITTRR
jgi:hypothetical protein